MLLELSFTHDKKSKVIAGFDSGTNKLQVLGIGSSQEHIMAVNRPEGGMVRAFYKYANSEVLIHTRGLTDFCDELRFSYLQVVRGGTAPSWLVGWFQEIYPHVEGLSPSEPRIRTGTAIRFYREDGPGNSWVWKDTVREASVLLRSAPNYVER